MANQILYFEKHISWNDIYQYLVAQHGFDVKVTDQDSEGGESCVTATFGHVSEKVSMIRFYPESKITDSLFDTMKLFTYHYKPIYAVVEVLSGYLSDNLGENLLADLGGGYTYNNWSGQYVKSGTDGYIYDLYSIMEETLVNFSHILREPGQQYPRVSIQLAAYLLTLAAIDAERVDGNTEGLPTTLSDFTLAGLRLEDQLSSWLKGEDVKFDIATIHKKEKPQCSEAHDGVTANHTHLFSQN